MACRARTLPCAGEGRANEDADMKHIIAVLLENEAGALSRVVGLFSARGYNIESLPLAPVRTVSKIALRSMASRKASFLA